MGFSIAACSARKYVVGAKQPGTGNMAIRVTAMPFGCVALKIAPNSLLSGFHQPENQSQNIPFLCEFPG